MLCHSRFAFAALACSLLPMAVQASPATEIAGRVQAPLHAIYEARQFEPIWLADGKPTARATAAVQLLEQADADGLDPRDYSAPALHQQLDSLQQHGGGDLQQAEFDLALSGAVEHYTRDMTMGRVAPRTLGLDIDTSGSLARIPMRLHSLLTADDLATAAARLQSAIPPYAALRALLANYRSLAAAHPQPPSLPPLPGKKLEPGQPWAGNAALTDWLITLGDLPAGTPVPSLYEGALVDGVNSFQSRHGLGSDGVIGKQTWEALQVPLSRRVQQIELAMERLRWLDDGHLAEHRFIAINIPQFTLWAFAPTPEGPRPQKVMRVVVGEAGKTETPVMTKTLSSLVFSPYWNVPRSIAMKELLPKLRKDPHYLEHEDMELVDKSGISHGSAFGKEQESRLVMGELRIRQRAGEKNALGKLKFVFPNDDSIYMHDTPSKKLFARDRRDFSHGCIRVSDPMGLALFALETQGEWDEDKVHAKIAASTDQHLALKERMPVLLLYMTANTDADGRALFFQDIYNQDAKLAAALDRSGHP